MQGLSGALKGIRILDATRVLAGPFCTQLLGDLGADVIKVEAPDGGDETRGWGPPFDDASGLSAYFLSCNRNKRSIVLNLKTRGGRQTFLDLAAKSDIVIDNLRHQSAANLQLGSRELHAVNPRLVHLTISGYGKGPVWGPKPGYDFVVQGLSGLMAVTGPEAGPPSKVGVAIADIVTGLYTAIAGLSALHARTVSGHGYAVDIALVDCAVASLANVAQAFLSSGQTPRRQGNSHAQIVPYQLFATSDGWMVLAVGNDAQWQTFCRVAQRPDLGANERFAANADRVRGRAVLLPIVAEIMKQSTTAVWLGLLEAARIPCGPVWDLAQLFQSDLARERQLKITAKRPDGTTVELIRSPLLDDMGEVRAPAKHGQDTTSVLQDLLGFDAMKLESLRQEGAI